MQWKRIFMNKTTILKAKQNIELVPLAPFNFDASLHKPDHFPAADTGWEPGVRWQTMRWQGQPLGLVFENQGTVARPRIALPIWSARQLGPDFTSRLTDEIIHRYSLQLDLTEFTRRFRSHPTLGPVLRKWRGMHPLNYSSLYEYLMIAIVLQNATVRRSVSMMQALLENYGTLLSYAGQRLYCFWKPQVMDTVTEQELRALKVGYRAKSIKRVTEAFVSGKIDEFELRSKSREQQRQALLGLYGIGPASVGYILSDVFHHMNELEYISPWEQKIYSKLFFDTDPEMPVPVEQLLAYFDEQFGEYRMLAVHYFWEDLFWKRKNEHVEWLDKLIRL